MAAAPDESPELPPPTPAPRELIERAAALVRTHAECFWFRHPEARIRHLEDVPLVVEHLREYGDRPARWAPRNCTDSSHRPGWIGDDPSLRRACADGARMLAHGSWARALTTAVERTPRLNRECALVAFPGRL